VKALISFHKIGGRYNNFLDFTAQMRRRFVAFASPALSLEDGTTNDDIHNFIRALENLVHAAVPEEQGISNIQTTNP
jgi:hypothetical protein